MKTNKQIKIKNQVHSIPEVFLFNQLLQANINATNQLQFPGGGKFSNDFKYLGASFYGLDVPRCVCVGT